MKMKTTYIEPDCFEIKLEAQANILVTSETVYPFSMESFLIENESLIWD